MYNALESFCSEILGLRKTWHKRDNAFTLVELMVVIAVIALLVVILLPALASARKNAQAVACAANVKQLIFSLDLYTLDNRYYPPSIYVSANASEPPGGYIGSASYDYQGWWWFQFLSKEIGTNFTSNSILRCPSRQVKHKFDIDENILWGNYGVNQSVCKSLPLKKSLLEFTGNSKVMSKIPQPSSVFLIVDSGYSIINWWHVTLHPPRPLQNTLADMNYLPGLSINSSKNIWNGQREDATKGRHMAKTVNTGYVDGHVQREPSEKFLVLFENNQYLNLRPGWCTE